MGIFCSRYSNKKDLEAVVKSLQTPQYTRSLHQLSPSAMKQYRSNTHRVKEN